MPSRTQYLGAAQFLPPSDDLATLAAAATGCRGCDLWENATQVVFGRGGAEARLMVVGEQPGDIEDTQGKPFIGPAGHILVQALKDADLFETPTYVTNAVKHFRWKPQGGGKRRIHEKPSAAQSTACRPWLAHELASVGPEVLVALGATAAASLFGPIFRLTQQRGERLGWPPEAGSFAGDGSAVGAALATIHPSAVLRADPAVRDAYYDGLVADLRVARTLLD